MVTNRTTIGNLPVDRVTLQEARRAVDALVQSGSGGFVVTPNIDHIVLARHDAGLRLAYQRARLSLADGQPLLWMARALGAPLPEKVSGSDLLDPLMADAAENGTPVFFFGATPAASAEAERRLALRHPRLRVVGRDCSHWSVEDRTDPADSPVVRAIRASGAGLVVVALGSPKQELWMAGHERAIAPAVAIGLGGSLDFAAGAVKRAPAWMSRAGLEWLFRLAQEPRRMAYRYLVRDLAILPIFINEMYRRVLRGANGNPRAGGEAGI